MNYCTSKTPEGYGALYIYDTNWCRCRFTSWHHHIQYEAANVKSLSLKGEEMALPACSASSPSSARPPAPDAGFITPQWGELLTSFS